MAKKLVIVESPAKAKTINKYLGNDYLVTASFGHVRDLPSSKIGIDTENNYEPKYLVPTKSKKTVSGIKKEAVLSEIIYLATDPDREGEAIAWHIVQACGLDSSKAKAQCIKRVAFSEITKDAILRAIDNPREIDMDLVDAQQARRILDRLVGYNLSPLLWKKIMRGLSAGRVQSVAVRMVVEREREIEAFKSDEYWDVTAVLEKMKKQFAAKLVEVSGRKLEKLSIKNEKEAKELTDKLENGKYKVKSIEEKQERRSPYAPFTTSTLQQEASNRFGYGAKQTMRIAQGLYESGHITYMRTDSLSLSTEAISAIRKYIGAKIGPDFLSSESRQYKTKSKGAQEAHEAIRPSDVTKTSEDLSSGLDEKQRKLYDLIWRRAVASQMKEALLDQVDVKVANGDYIFACRGQLIKFKGFLEVYPLKIGEMSLPNLEVGDDLGLVELKKEQHFTQPPGRYSEATLIKALEEKGIGRPSTYAPTMATIQDRGYVIKDSGKLKPEKIGIVVNDLLAEHFPDVVDYGFTAKVEDDLDRIAGGKLKWQKMVGDFYVPFEKNLKAKDGEIVKQDYTEEIGEDCPDCGKKLLMRRSKKGKFIGCSGFPECKYTRNYVDEKTQAKIDEGQKSIENRKCPKCEADLKIASGRFGPFIGCSRYPECKYIEKIKNK